MSPESLHTSKVSCWLYYNTYLAKIDSPIGWFNEVPRMGRTGIGPSLGGAQRRRSNYLRGSKSRNRVSVGETCRRIITGCPPAPARGWCRLLPAASLPIASWWVSRGAHPSLPGPPVTSSASVVLPSWKAACRWLFLRCVPGAPVQKPTSLVSSQPDGLPSPLAPRPSPLCPATCSES